MVYSGTAIGRTILGASLTFFFVGCGGGGGGGQADAGTYKTNVILLTGRDIRLEEKSATEAAVTLARDVKPGDVLFVTTGYGRILRVAGVKKTRNGESEVSAVNGSLEDTFSSLQATLKPAEPTPFLRPAKLAPGVVMDPPRPGEKLSMPSLRLDRAALSSGVHATGRITFDVDPDGTLDIGLGGIRKFGFTADVRVTAELTVTAETDVSAGGELDLLPIPIQGRFALGPVPCVVELDLVSQMRGSLKAGYSATLRATSRFKGGFIYENRSWSTVKEFEPVYEVSAASKPYARAEFNWSILKPSVSLKIADVVGPYVHADLPRVSGFAEPRGQCVFLQADWGVSAGGGVKVEVLGRSLLDQSFPNFFDRTGRLVEREFDCKNAAPVATDGYTETSQDQPIGLTMQARDPDGDPLTFEVFEAPTNGSLSGDGPNRIYTPNPGFSGNDRLRFRARDASSTSNDAIISLYVRPSGGGGGGGGGTDIVIDDLQAVGNPAEVGFNRYSLAGFEQWWRQGSDCGYQAHYWYCWNNTPGRAPENTASWRANLPTTQNWELFAYVPECEGRTYSAQYQVFVSEAHVATVRVNQLGTKGWISLGTYWMPAGTGNFVKLIDETNEPYGQFRIAFDAMRWSPR